MLKKTGVCLLALSLAVPSVAGTGYAKKDSTFQLKQAVLSNQVIEGDLVITPAAGKNITLENVTVKGSTYIKGKAPESLTITDSSLQKLAFNNSPHNTEVTVSGDTFISLTELESGASLTETELTNEGFEAITLLNGTNAELNGEFTDVTVKGKNKGLSKKENELDINGIVDRLFLNALTDVDLPLDSLVKELTVSSLGGKSNISGEGLIQEANLEKAISFNGTATDNPDDFITPWSLVWHDEFNSTEIDRSKWDFEIGNGFTDANGEFISGWGNNEKQYYTDRPENAKTEDGKLSITALKEEYEGFDYTSARLRTKGLFSKTYGKFEMKASLPVGKGMWPAFWMLPEEDRYGGWAASGEIDILEAKGSRPHEAIGTIHYGETWPNNKYTGAEYTFPDGSTIADEHIYSVEWEPGEIRWYVDGVLYQTQDNWYSKERNASANHAYPAPFDQPFHMLLNLAVGGNFDGEPTEDTVFPQSMDVEYVRVYDLTGRDYKTPELPVVEAEPLPENAKLPLEDGNLVYNSGFNQDSPDVAGIDGVANTDHWYFLTVPDFGGQASVSLEDLNGQTFARTDIQNGGSQPYSVQLIQDVTIGKGRYYKVSFDAKSTQSRNINVKVSGDADRDYATYSSSESFALSSDLKTYEMTFQMTEETDVAARLEFNLGLSTLPVWIGNVKVEETEAPELNEDASKDPLSNGNLVYNGTFDQGFPDRLLFWNIEKTDENAVVQVDADRRVFTSQSDQEPDAVQLIQKGIQLQNEGDYELTLDLKSDESNEVLVEFLSEDGSEVYHSETLSVTDDWSTQTSAFTMSGLDDLNAQLVLSVGGGLIEADNVFLKKTGNPVDLVPVKNGEFESSLESWNSYIHFDAQASVAQVDGKAVIDITQQGQEAWSVQFFQDGLTLEPGKTYTLSFDAASTLTRNIEVTVENAAYTRYLSEVVSIAEGEQAYEFTFTVPEKGPLSLKFLLGATEGASFEGHTLTFDNVVLK
ncbi:carbohydrate binding domain-containing protein [Jeotgalibacillus sp. R-1-5s-1]|uniref:carbohydrate binding domain-containing protein n=1 Tax=Jeotgalibacillus sp. R-1-5s-1 TaxID=2555897 RepID=UPI00106AE2A5|nr:carbohydrate binding domain-containing protein [Jeotgalibacillus sp. R-1-5s-1]TFD92860.1 glycosyl hydrolase family protein [Jeotgalibacillus sp. R-1-5s-1]